MIQLDERPPQSQQPQQLAPNRAMVLAVITFAGFLITFMTSAINVALPLIQEEFNISAVTLSWVSLSYILVAGATLLPLGRASDLYGRMRFFILGMIIFTVFSFASAFAWSASVLIVLRAIHGLGLALGAVVATALVILAYPLESRGRAVGLNVAGVYLGLTAGPVLGGLIIHNLGWRGLFLVVGGLSLLNLGLALWKLRDVDWQEPRQGRFDIEGSVIFAMALPALLAGFSFLPGVVGIVLVAVGIVGLAGFLWWEVRAADPLLDVALLRRNRVFAFSNAAALINYAATFAMVFLMSLYLQYNRGLNAQTAGFVLVAGTFVQAIFSPLAGRLVDRVNARWVASTGMAVCVFGLFALAFVGATTPYWFIIAMLCVLGLGFAFFSVPITHTVMCSVEKPRVGMASATLAMVRLVGQNLSMGIATLVLAIEVGRRAIQPGDYPQLLSSVRISFLIFAVLCIVGVGATIVGPRRGADL